MYWVFWRFLSAIRKRINLISAFNNLVLENMNGQQQVFARECDTVEASHDWEQQYGNLNEEELVAGIVYE